MENKEYKPQRVNDCNNERTKIKGQLRKARIANSLIFLVCGFAVSSWAPLIPLAKARLELGNASLGLLLLSFGTGAIIFMPVTGALIARVGTKKIILFSGIVLACMLPLLLFLKSIILMAISLFAFGIATGSIDVAMNAQAVLIQNRYGRHIMSSFHGLYSTGGILGSLGLGILISAGLSPYKSIFLISALLIAITISQFQKLLEGGDKVEGSSGFSFPKGLVIILGLMCFIMALVEGAMLDWSAVFLRYNRHVNSSFSGIGLTMFSVAMASMRLLGDKIINSVGSSRIVLMGGIISGGGLLLVVAVHNLASALIGFVMIGLGCANIIPIFFSTAGKMQESSKTSALSAVMTMGYSGILAGPAIIGFVAQIVSLPFALGVLAVFVLIVAVTFNITKLI